MWVYLSLAFTAGFLTDFIDWVVDAKKKHLLPLAHILSFLSGAMGGVLLSFSPNAVLGIVLGNAVAKKIDHPIYLVSLTSLLVIGILSTQGLLSLSPLLLLFGLFAYLDEIPHPFVRTYRPFLKGAALGLFCIAPNESLTILLFDLGYHLNDLFLTSWKNAKPST